MKLRFPQNQLKCIFFTFRCLRGSLEIEFCFYIKEGEKKLLKYQAVKGNCTDMRNQTKHLLYYFR